MEQPFLSLMACMTPADLEKHASRKSSLWGDGFWARFAMISPSSGLRPLTAESREGERVPPASLVRELRAWHERLGVPEVRRELVERADHTKFWEVEVNRQPPKAYPLAEGVKAAHDRYARALEGMAYEQNLEAMDGGYTRLAEKALRVSLALASMGGAERIELRHWARGQAIAERWRSGLHCMFEAVNGGGPVSTAEQVRVQAEERILRELRKKGREGVSANEVRMGSGLSVETCMDTLKRLAEAGVARVVRTNRAGKPVFALVEHA